jgi:hypothetical protein
MTEEPLDLERITGLSIAQLTELTRQVRILMGDVVQPGSRPATIGLAHSVAMVVSLVRNNITQDFAGAIFDVSQPTVSRRWDKLRAVIAAALHRFIPAPEKLVGRGTILVDGTIAPTWDWKSTAGMYSKKAGHTGFNIQIAANWNGDIAAVGEIPIRGSRHDAHAYHASGLAAKLDGLHTLGDKGYQAHTDLSPDKKPAHGKLTEKQKQNNRVLNSFRAAVERAVAHIKNWRMLQTPYRAPLEKYPQVLAMVIGLYFFTRAYE